jgi:threonine/homoserine/homoserine lactone efflux protein
VYNFGSSFEGRGDVELALIKYISIGGSLAFAAAVQPGPFQAYLFNRATSIGWKKTLPAALAPLLSDGPIAVLALIVLGRLTPAMQSGLRTAGGLLLLYLAWNAYRLRKSGGRDSLTKNNKAPRTLIEAALVNLLNPNPYIGWALILGPVAVTAWREAPGLGVAVVAAFYTTMIAMLAVLIVLFGGARLLGPGGRRALNWISVVILAALGVYQLWMGARYFAGN